MKLGVSAFAWAGKMDASLLDMLPAIRDLGLDGFEIPMFDPALLQVAEIRRAFEQSGLECTVCAILPSGINPISHDARVRQRSMQHLKRCVETAAQLGAKLLGGPLYAPMAISPAIGLRRASGSGQPRYFKRSAKLLMHAASRSPLSP